MSERSAAPDLSQGLGDISLIFAAREDAVRLALDAVRTSLHALGIGDDTKGAVEIVLAEATNNIVEHAYEDCTTGTIELNGCLRNGILLFELRDRGKSLPHKRIPRKQHHDLAADLERLPEGGFGWGLIRDMTQSLAYRRVDGQNILRFALGNAHG